MRVFLGGIWEVEMGTALVTNVVLNGEISIDLLESTVNLLIGEDMRPSLPRPPLILLDNILC